MGKLRIWQKIALIVPVLAGAAAGFLGYGLLLLISVAALYIIVGLLPRLKGKRFIFAFFFMIPTCLPFNIQISRKLFDRLNAGDAAAVKNAAFCVAFVLILMSIEMIVSGLVSYFLWGDLPD